MTFKFGKEMFRKVSTNVPRYFRKGVEFAGGKRFPLERGTVNVDKVKPEVSVFMYPVKKDK